MTTHVVRKGGIYRSGIALKINKIFICIECAMGYHTSKITIPYQTYRFSLICLFIHSVTYVTLDMSNY